MGIGAPGPMTYQLTARSMFPYLSGLGSTQHFGDIAPVDAATSPPAACSLLFSAAPRLPAPTSARRRPCPCPRSSCCLEADVRRPRLFRFLSWRAAMAVKSSAGLRFPTCAYLDAATHSHVSSKIAPRRHAPRVSHAFLRAGSRKPIGSPDRSLRRACPTGTGYFIDDQIQGKEYCQVRQRR